MSGAEPHDLKMEPEFLGPLGAAPLAGSPSSSIGQDLFPGADGFLAPRHQRKRRAQWNAAQPLVKRLLSPGEHVLYVTHAMQMPPALHTLALGAMALPYHQVVLVLTDARLIEVLLGVRGQNAETRLRSFPWASVRDLKLSFGKLALAPADGRKQAWKVPLRGDRQLLKLLLPRLQPLLLQEGAQAARHLPLWHCPQCGAAVAENPRSCEGCHTAFRSTRLAALLSLAFPGAGLFYAGHPFLATLDFLGEVALYALFLLMLLENGPRSLAIALGVGSVMFLMTKLESIHLSHILTARSKPDTDARQFGYKRFAIAGGLASLLIIAAAFPLAAAGRPVLDRDLEVGGQDSLWTGSRNSGEWEFFADETSARSQWRHPSGLHVTLFAYPQGVLDSVADFRNNFRASLQRQGVQLVKDDENVPAPYHGFRFVWISRTEEGGQASLIHYFIEDEANHDLHQAVAIVNPENSDRAEELVRDLLSHARWIAATAPERPNLAHNTASLDGR